MASGRSCPKLPPCPRNILTVSSRKDLPLCKTTNGVSAAGITELIREKCYCPGAIATGREGENG